MGLSFTKFRNCWLAVFESILLLCKIKYTKGISVDVKSFPFIFLIHDRLSFAKLVNLLTQSWIVSLVL